MTRIADLFSRPLYARDRLHHRVEARGSRSICYSFGMYINEWYVMAQSEELTNRPLKVKALGQDFALFRGCSEKNFFDFTMKSGTLNPHFLAALILL